MEILVEQAADRVIVRVVGDVTASRSGDLEDRVVPSVGAGLPPVDIDLAGMSFLSSTGLAVLVRLMRQARQHKQPMHLLRPGAAHRADAADREHAHRRLTHGTPRAATMRTSHGDARAPSVR